MSPRLSKPSLQLRIACRKSVVRQKIVNLDYILFTLNKSYYTRNRGTIRYSGGDIIYVALVGKCVSRKTDKHDNKAQTSTNRQESTESGYAEHIESIADGCGCAEVWEYLSEYRTNHG